MSTSNYVEKILRGAFLVFASMFFGKLFAYLTIILIATSLGSEKYGVLSLGIAIFSFLNAFSLLGLDEGIIRFVSYFKGKNDFESLKGTISYSLKTAFNASIFFSLLLIVLSDFIAENIFNEYELTKVLLFMALALPFNAVGQIFLASFRAFQKAEYEVLIKELIEKSSRLILTLILIYLGYDLFGALFGFLFGISIMCITSVFLFNKKIFNIFNKEIKQKENKNELLNFSLPLLLKNFMWFVIAWTDLLMIGYFKTTSDVGIYNVALPTSNLIIVPAYGIMYLFLPVISELYGKNNLDEIKSVYKRISKYTLMLNIPIFLIIFILSKDIINLFFGNEYINAAMPLLILSSGYLLYSLSDISINILSVLKKTKTIFGIIFLFALSNVVLNYLLIPKFGLIGAATATSISFVLGSLCMIFVCYYHTKLYPFMFPCLKILFALILTLIIGLLIKNIASFSPLMNVIILLIIILGLYSVLIYSLKVLEKEDFELIKSFKNKILKK